MANEQSGNPLRMWRPFYGAFVAIDDAIEAAGHPRAAFRDTRVGILRLLRAATDDGVAEQLCAAHDDAMAEALKTLLVVTPVPHGLLASTDLENTIAALRNHESTRVRSLAGDVLREWKMAAAVKRVVSKMEAKKKPPVAAQTQSEKKKQAKKQPTIITQSEKKKMTETTKRKLLHEGYEEAKMVKRQHLMKKIEDKEEAPKVLEQSQRKMHSKMCRTSSGVRRSLLPSLLV